MVGEDHCLPPIVGWEEVRGAQESIINGLESRLMDIETWAEEKQTLPQQLAEVSGDGTFDGECRGFVEMHRKNFDGTEFAFD